MLMRHVVRQDTIFLYPETGTDPQLAGQTEAELIALCRANPGCRIVIDLAHIRNTSPDDFFILMKILHLAPRIELLNVGDGVYDTLEATGVTDLFSISRTPHHISIAGCPVLGSDAVGTLYRLDDDTIAKVFSPRTPALMIEREPHCAARLYQKGIPAAISFKVVRCGSQSAILYDLPGTETLANVFAAHPEQEDAFVDRYLDLLQNCNAVTAEPDLLPSASQLLYRAGLHMTDCVCPAAVTEKLQQIVLRLPEPHGFLHGDCHPGNIMVQGDELFLIDLSAAAAGHPIIELSGIHTVLDVLPQHLPAEEYIARYRMRPEQARRIWQRLFSRYFAGRDAAFREKAAYQISLLSDYRLLCGMALWELPSLSVHRDALIRRLLEAIDRGLEPICF